MTTHGLWLDDSRAPLESGAPGDALETTSPEGQIQAVSQAEFAVQCERHLDQVFRQLRVMGVADRYLDDATQEVFLVAHQKLHEFAARAKLSTWLYAIAYRVGCNYRRKAHRDPQDELIEEEHRGKGRDPEQSLADKEAAFFVQKFCDSLSEKLRDVFVLCILEGQPTVEVAALLGIPENTVYSRVRLVREAFRAELEKSSEQFS